MKRKPQELKYRLVARHNDDDDAGAVQVADDLEIFIFDEISPFFGVSAERIGVLLAEHPDVKLITVHINSPGGSVFDGVAIYNSLVSHKATVDVIVEGMALSAASLIAMSGDTIKMAAGAQMMVHEARGSKHGTADELQKFVELIRATSGQMAAIYSARSGRTIQVVKAEMKEETFMTAEEAVEMGYATEVIEAKAVAAKFDLAALGLNDVPDAVRELASAAVQPPVMLKRRNDREISPPDDGGDNGAMVAPTPIAVMSGLRPASLVSDFGRKSK